jgi:hypothetical protein
VSTIKLVAKPDFWVAAGVARFSARSTKIRADSRPLLQFQQYAVNTA